MNIQFSATYRLKCVPADSNTVDWGNQWKVGVVRPADHAKRQVLTHLREKGVPAGFSMVNVGPIVTYDTYAHQMGVYGQVRAALAAQRPPERSAVSNRFSLEREIADLTQKGQQGESLNRLKALHAEACENVMVLLEPDKLEEMKKLGVSVSTHEAQLNLSARLKAQFPLRRDPKAEDKDVKTLLVKYRQAGPNFEDPVTVTNLDELLAQVEAEK